MLSKPIPTFVINMKGRPERRHHAWEEFKGKSEFDVTVVDAHEDEIGAVGLWRSIIHIVSSVVTTDDEFVLICEDDHQFTRDYSSELLSTCIDVGKVCGADLIVGGVSFTNSILPVSGTLFWTEWFWGTQFTIIFRKFFPVLLNAPFGPNDSADDKYSELTFNKFFIHPFVSIQKEFGYSDASPTFNYLQNNVSQQFFSAMDLVERLVEKRRFVNSGNFLELTTDELVLEDISISTHLIYEPDQEEAIVGCTTQFTDKNEFDVELHVTDGNENPELAKWVVLQNIVRKVIESEDVIIVTTPEHIFTNTYSPKLLLRNIFEAYDQGVDILVGSTSNSFTHAMLVGKSRFWLSDFDRANFIVLYRDVFDSILTFEFAAGMSLCSALSTLATRKMVLFPFISAFDRRCFAMEVADCGHAVGRLKNIMLANEEFVDPCSS